ncbi:cytochrome P450 [Aspergillus heteromorphus CBS 117.55]|uniref:Cytochrome P450 n=1 Tax=Aspergillus heteromorphus CBS 117.55 TaxID=1448321 RepID=A0A317WVS4_9EURO|nr:cytochrome P450 [Aspergillus heteromorphus CBS 117.55]PWY88380.1 cytochrome P450 [Aspergillus heteromorphus CBS 117.55]
MPLREAIFETLEIDGVYFGTLVTSMITYRLFFSPLHHLPGPLWARITKLHHVWKIRHADNYRYTNQLHHQYGDVVRTGPNEVMLFTTDAFMKIYGPGSKCTRGTFYDMMLPLVSIVTTRNAQIHTHKRKLWAQGLGVKALEVWEPKVFAHAQELVNQLRKQINKSIDMSKWTEYYTFDLMGLIGFNIKFGLLQKHKHLALDMYSAGHPVLGVIAPTPWLYFLTHAIPYAQEGYKMFAGWAEKQLRAKIESKSHDKDILSHVIRDAQENGGVTANWNHLLGDFILLFSAGSDAARQTLTNVLYYLVRYPEHRQQICAELKALETIHSHRALQQLPHLNAVIKETMRLHPPVPCAGLRITPPEGIHIHDTFIPGGTTVLVPHYTLFRRPDSFTHPDDFIPERFSTKPELVLDSRTWQPFSAGDYQCIGKNLGMMEIRVGLAMLLMNFEFDWADADRGERVLVDAKDYFTTVPGRLELIVRERGD